MVREVKLPVIGGVEEDAEARQPADDVVQPSAAERRVVHALVHDREERDEDEALEQQRCRQPPASAAYLNRDGARQQQTGVDRGPPGALPVGFRVQLAKHAGGNQSHLLGAPSRTAPRGRRGGLASERAQKRGSRGGGGQATAPGAQLRWNISPPKKTTVSPSSIGSPQAGQLRSGPSMVKVYRRGEVR
jgi:hypothetical protein